MYNFLKGHYIIEGEWLFKERTCSFLSFFLFVLIKFFCGFHCNCFSDHLDLTFQLESGINILVTGESGSGKSSLIRMINGLWPVTSGKH